MRGGEKWKARVCRRKKKQLTFPSRASAVFDVGSDTFERFEPKCCPPPEETTEGGNVDDTSVHGHMLWLLHKKKREL